MDQATAQKLMSLYQDIGLVLNEADTVIRTLPDAERHQHLSGLAETVMQIWSKLQLPVVRQYPELDPDREHFRKSSDA
ncbi:hypothetical protein [Janthinobacterium sp. RB2R34]|uniref:hypothetical protein n=1 Tax=Janthinobacterium sp. RB2R34 TaxID=3424193 RepID=UPI003F2590B0